MIFKKHLPRFQSLYKKMKISIKDSFSKCDQIHRIWSHSLNKSLMEKLCFFVQWIQVNHWCYVFHKIARESVISRTISKNTFEKNKG